MGDAAEGLAEGRSRVAGHLALLAVQVCFGLFPIFGLWAFMPGGFEPAAVAAWRIGGGALLLVALGLLVESRAMLPARADLARLACASLLGVTLNQGLYLEGLARSSAVHAGLIMCTIPVFTFVVAAIAGQERFQALRALGVLVAGAGTAQLFLGRGAALFSANWQGNALMVLNSLCYSVYLVISRPLVRRWRPLPMLAWLYVFALPVLPLFVARGGWVAGDAGAQRAWWSLLYIVLVPTVLGYLLNLFALARVRASTTAFYVYLQPLVTGLGGALLLGERVGPEVLLAGGTLFVGVWLVLRRPPDATTGPPAPRPTPR